MTNKNPQMVVCPKAGCKKVCNHKEVHERWEWCEITGNHCPACVPVSPPEPVKLYKCAPEDSSLWKCNWIECLGGCGLAGNGMCSDRGEWDNPNCPKFNKVPAHMYDKPEPVKPDEGLLLTNVIEELAEQLWRTYSHLVTYHALSYSEEPDDRKSEWRREASSIYGQLKCQQHEQEAIAQAKAEAYREIIAKVEAIPKEKHGTGVTSMSYAGGFNDALEKVLSQLTSGLPLEGKG